MIGSCCLTIRTAEVNTISHVTSAHILIFCLSSVCLQCGGAGHADDRAGLSLDSGRTRGGLPR